MGVPRLRARVTFGRSPKSDQKRCLKPQVSRLPARLGCAENRGRVPRENQDSADRRTTNRLYVSPRCRSRVPRENFLLSCRIEEVIYILHTFIFCGPKGRTYLSQPAGKRHPLPRPTFERPRWAHPAHTYLVMSPVAHPVGAGVPDGPFSVLRLRAAPASCMYASGGHISFNSERNMEKNAAKNQWFLDFLCAGFNAAGKGSAWN